MSDSLSLTFGNQFQVIFPQYCLTLIDKELSCFIAILDKNLHMIVKYIICVVCTVYYYWY